MALTLKTATALHGQVADTKMMLDLVEDIAGGTVGTLAWESTDGGRYRFTGGVGNNDSEKIIRSSSIGAAPYTNLISWVCIERLRFLGLPTSTTAAKFLVAVVPSDGVQGADNKVMLKLKWNAGASAWRFGLGDAIVAEAFTELSTVNVAVDTDYYININARNIAGNSQNEVQGLYVYSATGALLGSITPVIDQSGTFVASVVKVGLALNAISYEGLDMVVRGIAVFADDEAGGAINPGPQVVLPKLPAVVDFNDGPFTVGAGADLVTAVTETPATPNGHDGDTSYILNTTGTVNHEIRYTLGAHTLPAGVQVKTVRALVANTVHEHTGSAPTVNIGIRSGASATLAAAGTSLNSYRHRQVIVSLDPATAAAWTEAAVNSALLVVKDADVVNRPFRTTMAWAALVAEIEAQAAAGGPSFLTLMSLLDLDR